MVFQEMIPWRKERRPLAPNLAENAYPLSALQRRMNRMFDDFFGDIDAFTGIPLGLAARRGDGFVPRMDVSETEEAITLTAELAGLDEKDVEVTLTDNILTLKGEKKVEKDERSFVSERSYGTFSRSLALPETVETDSIDALFKKGVLTVRLKKTPLPEPKAKKIEIKTE